MKMFNWILVVLSMIAIPTMAMADNYFDDDIISLEHKINQVAYYD